MRARDLPGRVATGAYILHAGLDKWNGDEARAEAVQGMAAGAFPIVKSVPPTTFLRLLAAAEIATGASLLAPFVSNAKAGLALTGFSGGLIAMYWRTEALHKPGSVWPTPAGIAISKDVWMLGIGVGLLVDSLTSRRKKNRK
ncbi:MAG: hypothetical protein ACLP6E_13000 [Acidimicrobiales bacterium]